MQPIMLQNLIHAKHYMLFNLTSISNSSNLKVLPEELLIKTIYLKQPLH